MSIWSLYFTWKWLKRHRNRQEASRNNTRRSRSKEKGWVSPSHHHTSSFKVCMFIPAFTSLPLFSSSLHLNFSTLSICLARISTHSTLATLDRASSQFSPLLSLHFSLGYFTLTRSFQATWHVLLIRLLERSDKNRLSAREKERKEERAAFRKYTSVHWPVFARSREKTSLSIYS